MRSESSSRITARRVASRRHRIATCLVMTLLIATHRAFCQNPGASAGDDLPADMDRVASDVYRPGLPGAAIIVAKNGQVIFRKGYGVANLELQVPIKPDMVFRIASITKQF